MISLIHGINSFTYLLVLWIQTWEKRSSSKSDKTNGYDIQGLDVAKQKRKMGKETTEIHFAKFVCLLNRASRLMEETSYEFPEEQNRLI